MNPRGGSFFEQAQKAEQQGNREGRDLWELYAVHRERLTSAILDLAPAAGGGKLGLLGAGNGNDLDLERLAGRFDELHLIDIDAAAVARATNRQKPEVRAKLRAHAPVDLSGLYRQLDELKPPLPSFDDLVATGAAAVARQLPPGFDLAVSCCMLSQMSWSLTRTIGDEDDDLLALLQQATVNIHLRTLVALTPPGRPALIASDLVSSDRFPLEEAAAETDLRTLATQIAEQKQAYAVSNPDLMRQILRRDRTLRDQCGPIEMGEPWLWTGSQERTYLVAPLVLRRR